MSNDLDALIADLGRVPGSAPKRVRQALEVTARKMKDSWRDAAKGPSGAHARGYPYSIDYTVGKGYRLEAEVGPSLGGPQGALGILEDAPGGVTAHPQSLRGQVIQDNEGDFEKGLDDALADALREARL